jgi:hypothetical protein
MGKRRCALDRAWNRKTLGRSGRAPYQVISNQYVSNQFSKPRHSCFCLLITDPFRGEDDNEPTTITRGFTARSSGE